MRESRTLVVIVLVVLVAVIALCLGLGYLTFVQLIQVEQGALRGIQGTATRVVQQTTIARSTGEAAQATVTAQANWPLVLSDHFESDRNENGWSVGPLDSENFIGKRIISGGAYHWNLRALKDAMLWDVPRTASVSDFYLTADLKQTSESTQPQYGLVFRYVDNDNFYRFLIKDDRQFWISVRYQGDYIKLMDWTEAATIRPGAVNRLGVSARGSHFMFFINDRYVGGLDDDHLSRGKAGFLTIVHENESTDLVFDNFEVRAPDGQGLPTGTETLAAAQATPVGTPSSAIANVTQAAAAQATITARAQWPVILSDSFDSNLNLNDWPMGSFSDAFAKGERRMTNGVYHWEVQAVKSFSGRILPKLATISNYQVSVDARKVSGARKTQFGLAFRYVSGNYYRFLIDDEDQLFSVHLRQGTDWETLIGWSPSDAIRTGEVNRLTVSAEGPHFTFLINGKYVAEFQDERLTFGNVGLAYQMEHPDDRAVLEFDNFEVRAPPGQSIYPTPTPTPRGTPNSQD